jgi:adenylate cyclase
MDGITDWLGDADRLAALGRRLREGGVPVDRLALYRRTLHPEILGRATGWAPNRPIEIFDREHGLDLSEGFIGSLLDRVIAGSASGTLTGPQIEHAPGRWTDPLRGFGLCAALVIPLPRGTALAVGTRLGTGFSESDARVIGRLATTFATGAKRQTGISQ